MSRISFSAASTMALLKALVLMSVTLATVRAQLDSGLPAAANWTDARCTFYGGLDAAGTMGGACGYGNLYQTGYGVKTAALSTVLFNGGKSCGACFEIKCISAQSKWCYPGAGSITVTATNLCPPNLARTTDGWCNPPQAHFDLAYPMFAMLAERVAGVVPVQYRRVPCIKQGGIRFIMDGNPWFNLVTVFNVGGAGNVAALEMKGSETDYLPMTHNWGSLWELRHTLVGQAISIRITLGDGKQIISTNVAPESWDFGQSFECPNNV